MYEPDEAKHAAFRRRYPEVKVARSLDEILNDAEVKLVTAAAVPSERGAIGCRVMEAGKDYFTDKTPFTTMEQLTQARAVAARTGRKYMVYYSERLHVESAMFATDLVQSGVLGRVVQVVGLGPHRLGKAGRPAWFLNAKNTAASCATSAVISSSSFSRTRARRRPPCLRRRSAISPNPTSPSSRTSARPPWWATTVRRI